MSTTYTTYATYKNLTKKRRKSNDVVITQERAKMAKIVDIDALSRYRASSTLPRVNKDELLTASVVSFNDTTYTIAYNNIDRKELKASPILPKRGILVKWIDV